MADFWDTDLTSWLGDAADSVVSSVPDLSSMMDQIDRPSDWGDYWGNIGSDTADRALSFFKDTPVSDLYGVSAGGGNWWDQLKSNPLGALGALYQKGTKGAGADGKGMSPIGAGVSGLMALSQYLNQKKVAQMQREMYNTQREWAGQDRDYLMKQRAQQQVLNSPFDTQVTNRNYVAQDPRLAASAGRLNRATGQVYSPVYYDRDRPQVSIVPRSSVSASANPLAFAQGGRVPRGALGMVAGGSSGQADEVPARLSGGEYVMDADVVSALGDGNTEAGAAKLDQMRQEVRQHKRSAPKGKIPPKAKSPLQYMKGGK